MKLAPAVVGRVKAAVGAVTSIFGDRATPPARPLRGSFWGWGSETFTGAWQRGAEPEPIGALTTFGAVFACVSRIAGDIAKLDLQVMKKQDDGTMQPAPDASPFWIPLRKPNAFQNRIQFVTYWLTCKLLHGNAYALKARDGKNMVAGLYLLDPRRVCPMVTPDGDVYYSLGGSDLAKIPTGGVVPASEIIHDRGVTLWNALVGVSPLMACAMSATVGLRIQANSERLFANMSRPSGMLTANGTISAETADRLKKEFEANYGGGNIGKLAVLGDGLKYEPMTIAPETAQLIEQLKWTVDDVARAFGMPLYKIGAGQMPTNNNVEALNQQYYSDCLQTYMEAMELALDEGLATPTGYSVEFNLDGLMRMDQLTRIEMLAKGVSGAIIKPDEARARLNLPPVDGGNAIYLQEQNYSLAALAKRDALPDPFASKKTAAPAPVPAPALPEAAKDFDVMALVKALDEAELLCG